MESIQKVFTRFWNQDLIASLLRHISHMTIEGKTVTPICDSLNLTLEKVRTALIQKLIVLFGSNLALENLLTWKEAGFKEHQKKYLSEVIETLEIEDPRHFSEGFFIQKETILHKYPRPFALPFSYNLMTRLKEIWEPISEEDQSLDFKVIFLCPFCFLFFCYVLFCFFFFFFFFFFFSSFFPFFLPLLLI